jgi:CRP-like cAMP-binding protein
MIEAHLLKLRARERISSSEEKAVRDLVSGTRRAPAHATIIRQGEELNLSLLLLEGWLGRTKDVLKGHRQILELHVPGDFADLHSFTLKVLDHDIVALTPVTVATVPHERLHRLTEQHPHLARLYWLVTNIDAAIQRESTLSLGRRSAEARVAHLFCELFERLRVANLVDHDSYDFPLTQSQISECLGLTPVHTNRTLQALRAKGVLTLEQRRLTILDREQLNAIAEFDPSYLYIRQRPV